MMRPQVERIVTAAILGVFGTSGIGIEDAKHSPITFRRALADDDIDALIRGSQERHGMYVRCESVTAAGGSNCGELRLLMTYGAHYYHFSGHQEKAEQSAFDVLFATVHVVGQEKAKPNGAAGSGGHFGITGSSNVHYIYDVFPEPIGEMRVRALDSVDADGAGENQNIVKGEYRFGIGFRLDISGGVD